MTAGDVQVLVDEDVVEVGGVLTGRLVRQPDTDGILEKSRARSVRLQLRNFTEGRGDTDSTIARETELRIETHGGLDAPFRLEVPHYGPISYDGRLIRVKWELRARLDLKMARDATTTVPVLVLPAGGWAIYDKAHPLKGSSDQFGQAT